MISTRPWLANHLNHSSAIWNYTEVYMNLCHLPQRYETQKYQTYNSDGGYKIEFCLKLDNCVYSQCHIQFIFNSLINYSPLFLNKVVSRLYSRVGLVPVKCLFWTSTALDTAYAGASVIYFIWQNYWTNRNNRSWLTPPLCTTALLSVHLMFTETGN